MLTDLRPLTLNTSWKVVWLECIKIKSCVITNTTKYPNITTLAHTIGGEGFDDLSSFVVIDKLLVNKPISEVKIIEVVFKTSDPKEHSDNDERDHVLNAELFPESLELASKLDYHFGKHNLNEERAKKFQRELNR